jgi:hypothetical protein
VELRDSGALVAVSLLSEPNVVVTAAMPAAFTSFQSW